VLKAISRLLGARDASPFTGEGNSDDGVFWPNGDPRPDYAIAYSPVTGSDMRGLPNIQLFQTGAYPERDDGPQWSMEQGIGRAPGQQWPRQVHREQYSFDKQQVQGFGIMEDGTADLPVESNANPIVGRQERTGWVLPGPAGGISYYYGQYVDQHDPKVDPISTEVPGTMPYTALTEVPA
jgi:hypothetical protein